MKLEFLERVFGANLGGFIEFLWKLICVLIFTLVWLDERVLSLHEILGVPFCLYKPKDTKKNNKQRGVHFFFMSYLIQKNLKTH